MFSVVVVKSIIWCFSCDFDAAIIWCIMSLVVGKRNGCYSWKGYPARRLKTDAFKCCHFAGHEWKRTGSFLLPRGFLFFSHASPHRSGTSCCLCISLYLYFLYLFMIFKIPIFNLILTFHLNQLHLFTTTSQSIT